MRLLDFLFGSKSIKLLLISKQTEPSDSLHLESDKEVLLMYKNQSLIFHKK